MNRRRPRKTIALAGTAIAAGLFLGVDTSAQEMPVDLELVLAVDVSLSTQFEESAAQRRGYIRAFLNEEVIAAIQSGPHGRIAVTYFEWSGVGQQDILVPWMVVDGPQTARTLATLLVEAPLRREHTTSVSDALMFGLALIEGNAYGGERRVIDISGDGPNNAGADIRSARELVVSRGVTINGLPTVVRPDPWVDVFQGGIPAYYENCVIGGDGAFIVTVTRVADFTQSIRQKMVLEIASHREPSIGPPVGVQPVLPVQATPGFDCVAGNQITAPVPAP